MITLEQLKACLPTCSTPEIWVDLLNEEFENFNLPTKEQRAAFIAQTGHESGEYNVLVENTYYTKEVLLGLFPRYFTDVKVAERYAKNPEMIASRIYANRLGNGPESSKDGWTYRGRGLIKITGKDAYKEYSLAMFKDERLLATPNLLEEPRHALVSSLTLWKNQGLDEITDFIQLTKKLNEKILGYDNRKRLYDMALAVL